jgi:hypothetical protein
MNSYGELESGEKFGVGFRDNYYGQCWTFTKESDAIWRIYAPNKNGVKVTSTPRKLLKALYIQAGEFKDINSFIGRVEYWSTKKLLKQLNDGSLMRSLLIDPSGKGPVFTLLFKRIPFKHENEIRLIYNAQKPLNNKVYSFNIDPFDLFDKLVFDPRMPYSEFRQNKAILIKLGYKKSIVKSNLYRIPKLKFSFKNN